MASHSPINYNELKMLKLGSNVWTQRLMTSIKKSFRVTKKGLY